MSVTVIILNWNSEDALAQCLQCLPRQTTQPTRVLVINNGPTNQTICTLEMRWSKLNLVIENLGGNKGLAAANNIGVGLSDGKWTTFLNADAFPEPAWLEKLLRAAEQNTGYKFFSSRQIQARSPQLFDGAGDSYHITGLAWRRYYNRSIQDYGRQTEEVFSVCPTAALYGRAEFLKTGGFDEDYFSYFEVVDLGFRLRLAGKKCLYVPGAVVSHVGSASTGKRSDFSIYHGYRNLIWTFFKNMPSPLIWMFLPLHFSTLLFFGCYLSFRGH